MAGTYVSKLTGLTLTVSATGMEFYRVAATRNGVALKPFSANVRELRSLLDAGQYVKQPHGGGAPMS